MLDAMYWFQETLVGFDGLLFDLSIKATVILVIALLVNAALRRRSAALRHTVYTLGLASLFLLPALTIWLPSWRVALPVSTAEKTAFDSASAEVDATFNGLTNSGFRTDENRLRHVAIPPLHRLSLAADQTRKTTATEDISNVSLLAIIWSVGAGIVAFSTLLGFVRARRLCAISTEIRDSNWLRELNNFTSCNPTLRHIKLLENSSAYYSPQALPQYSPKSFKLQVRSRSGIGITFP